VAGNTDTGMLSIFTEVNAACDFGTSMTLVQNLPF
jgi:hypothetical protein